MKKLSVSLVLIFLSIVFIFSCQKDKDNITYPAGESNNLRTTVTGMVLDESNAPVTGVTVSAYGQTTTTNQYGTFVLKNINANKDRCVLEFSKTGFFKRSHGFIAAGNTVNYVRIVLISNASSQNFSASTGGTVLLTDGSSVNFQPNSFVTAANGSAYNGTVNIAIKHLSPDGANFGFMIPGGDLLAKNMNDEDVALYTYGMLGVELTGSSGEALQLAAGSFATLTMAIAASQLSSAPTTIPLWYFDEITSLWKEEGTANKVGNNYVGTVAHFSWWNCDYPGGMATIKGKVVDCYGIPLPNIVITITASNGFSNTVMTNQNGLYQVIIAAGFASTVQVLASNNPIISQDSQPENVPFLAVGQTHTVNDIVAACITRVIGNIKTCTGEATDGFVSISNASSYLFQFTVNGGFNMAAPENAQMVLYAINNSSSNEYSQNITTLAAPNNLNVGNLLLCNSITMQPNSFILNGGGFSNQTLNFIIANSTASIAQDTGSYSIFIQMDGSALPNYTISNYTIYINDTIPGISPGWISTQMNNGTNSSSVYGSVTVNVAEVGTVGNHIKGTYSGNPYINGSQGTITGSFDVIRTQ
jgi:hypothetical protein